MLLRRRPPLQPCVRAGGNHCKNYYKNGLSYCQRGKRDKERGSSGRGTPGIKNDSQEIFRYEYVHADADIYVRHKLSYYYEFPLEYEAEVSEGTVKRGGYLKLGNWYLEISKKLPEGFRKTTEEFPLRITENFKLPVSFGRITMEEYKKDSVHLYKKSRQRHWH